MVLGAVQQLEKYNRLSVINGGQPAFLCPSGGESIKKVKEKPLFSKNAKEKIQSAPKELLRRGLLDGTEKLRGQLRDAAQGGQREDTEADRTQDAARIGVQKAAYQVKKLVLGKKNTRGGGRSTVPDAPNPPSDDTPVAPYTPAPDASAGIPQDSGAPARIKTRKAAQDPVPVERRVRADRPQIKTKENVRVATSAEHSLADVVKLDLPQIKTRDPVREPLPAGRYLTDPVRAGAHQVKVKDARVHRQVEGAGSTAPTGAASSDGQSSQPMEQGRLKFVREQRQKAAALRAERQREPQVDTLTGRRDDGTSGPGHTSTQATTKEHRTGKAVRKTASDEKRRIKEAGSRSVGRTVRQTVKGADPPRQAVQAGAHSAQAVQQTAQATFQARQRAVQAAEAAKRAVTTVDRPVVKTTASALRGAVSAIRGLMAPLAAGGGAVIAVVLVLCLVGALLMSPVGIFFSGEDSGSGLTMPVAVREINQEYNDRVEALKAGATYDAVSLSGSRAVWPEVLAVYAVKTVTDPTNGQDVVSMDARKKELLKQIFWDMNELSSFTSTVPGEEGEVDTTTLYITITHKTTDEMADLYGFDTEQRQQLAELLSDEYRDLWSAVLYGIGTGSGEIVAVALSQVGNVGGQPYWSWYGFSHRVDWCAIFVSWCANECGYIDAGVIPKFAGCVQGSRWFKERGLWQDKIYTPSPGDVVFFDWDDPGGFSGPQDGVPDHVGIVEKVENGRVYTVEGNSGDKCCQRSYPVGYYEIYGYGMLCP